MLLLATAWFADWCEGEFDYWRAVENNPPVNSFHPVQFAGTSPSSSFFFLPSAGQQSKPLSDAQSEWSGSFGNGSSSAGQRQMIGAAFTGQSVLQGNSSTPGAPAKASSGSFFEQSNSTGVSAGMLGEVSSY